jgi:hypothetical protein
MSQVNGVGRQTKGARRAKPRVASSRSPLTALVVALSLIVQLLAVPYHQALAVGPGFAASGTDRIAAELKATFGDAAGLCVHAGDNGGGAPAGHCEDQCPLCQFAAQAAALIAPDVPGLPERRNGASKTLGAAPKTGAVPARETSRNRARAPPLAV